MKCLANNVKWKKQDIKLQDMKNAQDLKSQKCLEWGKYTQNVYNGRITDNY